MSTGRSYGGESADDRSARRRRQLIDAGLEVFGTSGHRQATVRALCREAQITDRYFYEQFDGIEDLLVGVYVECVQRLESAVLAAAATAGPEVVDVARAGLDAFLRVVQDDPRLARVVWFEILGVSPRVESLYLGRMRTFGDLLVGLVRGTPAAVDDAPAVRIVGDAAVGAVSHCVVVWSAEGFATPRSTLVDTLATFLAGAAAPLLHEA